MAQLSRINKPWNIWCGLHFTPTTANGRRTIQRFRVPAARLYLARNSGDERIYQQMGSLLAPYVRMVSAEEQGTIFPALFLIKYIHTSISFSLPVLQATLISGIRIFAWNMQGSSKNSSRVTPVIKSKSRTSPPWQKRWPTILWSMESFMTKPWQNSYYERKYRRAPSSRIQQYQRILCHVLYSGSSVYLELMKAKMHISMLHYEF